MQKNIEINEDTVSKELVYFFTHTINNCFCTAPSMIRDIIKRLNLKYEEDPKVLNELAALISTFSIINTLTRMLRLCVANQQRFESAWHEDNKGESAIELVLAFILRHTVNDILFSSVNEVKRRLPRGTQINIEALRESFINEVMVLELDNNNAEQVFHWLTQNLNFFLVALDKTNAPQFNKNGVRFTFLFAILSELIANALKYSNGEEQITMTWQMTPNGYEFTCCNPFNPETRHEEDSTVLKRV